MPKSKKRKKPSRQQIRFDIPKKNASQGEQDRYIDLGLQYYHAGDIGSAEIEFRKALEIEPASGTACSLMGVVSLSRSEPDNAVNYFQQAISLEPTIADHHFNLALALQEIGDFAGTCSAARTAIELHPHHAKAWNTLGQALLKLEEYASAEEALQKSIAFQPDMGEAWVNLCGALQELDDFSGAQNAGERGCELCPSIPQAHYNLARSFDRERKWDEAIASYSTALALNPYFIDALINVSRCFTKNGKPVDGEIAARRTLEIDPDNAEAYNNLGTALFEQGRYGESIPLLNRSIELDPTAPEPHNNLGHVLLVIEQFNPGWREYEFGFQTGERGPFTVTPAPVWNGEPLKGKRIHVYGEQGVGEQIMFATMLHDLHEAGARVIYECTPRLVDIFTRSMPWLTVVPLLVGDPHVDLLDDSIDYRVSSGSLGQWFRTSASRFHPHKKMLIPNPLLTSLYRDRYRHLGDGLIVGISWKSGSPNYADRKSIPIDQWRPILTTPNCHFVSLQYGDVDQDIALVEQNLGASIYVDEEVSALNSLEQSAAQAAAVDLVISISNATVHLSGACAVPTWTLLSEIPLWHWFLNRDRSLWYDSVRLFRQEREGNWAPLMEEIAAELERYSMNRNKV